MMTNHGRGGQRTVPTGPALSVCLALAASLVAATSLAFSSWLSADTRVTGVTSAPLGKGVLLVATPSLLDPNFSHTVILICDHGSAGTLGLVLNRPTNLLLSEALSDVPSLQGTAHLLFAGGPVQPDAMLMLLRLAKEPAQARRVLDGIYLGGNLKDLERIIAKPAPAETFRAFAGYAGWGPGQLASEMAQGSWRVLPADAKTIFEKNPADLWQELNGRPELPGQIQALDRWGTFGARSIVGFDAHVPETPFAG
nr:YqgE/AlgH family protein [Nitrospirota bacterium]